MCIINFPILSLYVDIVEYNIIPGEVGLSGIKERARQTHFNELKKIFKTKIPNFPQEVKVLQNYASTLENNKNPRPHSEVISRQSNKGLERLYTEQLINTFAERKFQVFAVQDS